MKIEEKRLNNLINKIQDNIKTIDKSKIDYNFIRTEELGRVVFNVFEKARIDYRNQKLKYYANMLINYSTLEFSSEFYKEVFAESISKFSIEHILVLNKIYEKHSEINDQKEINIKYSDNLIDGMNKETWDICVNTLYLEGFLEKGFWDEGYSLNNYGIKCVELIRDYSTQNK